MRGLIKSTLYLPGFPHPNPLPKGEGILWDSNGPKHIPSVFRIDTIAVIMCDSGLDMT